MLDVIWVGAALAMFAVLGLGIGVMGRLQVEE